LDLRERASAHFLRSAAAHEDAAVSLAGAVTEAGERLAHCLLDGHKILCAGTDGAASSALYMTRLLMNRYQRERPGLPALALACEPGSLGTDVTDNNVDDTIARQLRILGRAGDCLVLFAGLRTADSMVATMEAAKGRDIALILLDNSTDGIVAESLHNADVHIPGTSASSTLCHELHVTTVHCLCDLIDLQIFGEEL